MSSFIVESRLVVQVEKTYTLFQCAGRVSVFFSNEQHICTEATMFSFMLGPLVTAQEAAYFFSKSTASMHAECATIHGRAVAVSAGREEAEDRPDFFFRPMRSNLLPGPHNPRELGVALFHFASFFALFVKRSALVSILIGLRQNICTNGMFPLIFETLVFGW